MSIREKILAAVDLPMEEVKVDEWGVSVYVRMLSAGEVRKYIALLMDDKDDLNMVKVVILAACNEKGERIFTDADAEGLGKTNPFAIRKVYDKVVEMLRYDEKQLDELEKK